MVRGSQRWLILVVATPFLLAMGGGGRTSLSDSIPRPPENYRARLVDVRGIETQVEALSCGGKTFFPLVRGAGTLLVPFEKTRWVSVDAPAEGEAAVRLAVVGLDDLHGTLPGNLECTGETPYGNFRVDLRKLSRIEFLAP